MRLTDCFMKMIAATAFLVKEGEHSQVTYDAFRADMDRWIEEAGAKAAEAGIAPADYDLARFAVFAWIDEAILSSSWAGKQQWQRATLQRVHYRTADAGELFFDKLNAIGPHQRDVREVYTLCLELGFTGQYGNPGDEILLDQLKASNLKLLTGSSLEVPRLDDQVLFADAYPHGEPADSEAGRPGPALSAMTLAVAAAPVVLGGLLYLIYRFILGHAAQTLINTVG